MLREKGWQCLIKPSFYQGCVFLDLRKYAIQIEGAFREVISNPIHMEAFKAIKTVDRSPWFDPFGEVID